MKGLVIPDYFLNTLVLICKVGRYSYRSRSTPLLDSHEVGFLLKLTLHLYTCAYILNTKSLDYNYYCQLSVTVASPRGFEKLVPSSRVAGWRLDHSGPSPLYRLRRCQSGTITTLNRHHGFFLRHVCTIILIWRILPKLIYGGISIVFIPCSPC